MSSEYEGIKRAQAREAVRLFIEAPNSEESIRGIIAASKCGNIFSAKLETPNGRPAVVAFELHDKDGKLHKCRCNPATFSVLLCIIGLGQSVFINYTDGKPYVKICGKMDDGAGYVFARLIAEALKGEQVKYRNHNTLDLRHPNLWIPERKTLPKVEDAGESVADVKDRTASAMILDLLSKAISEEAPLFPGTPAEQHTAAWGLLQGALDRMQEERLAACATTI